MAANDWVTKELKIATRGGSQFDDMTGYGSDWPDTLEEQLNKQEEETFEQLELPLDLVQELKINKGVQKKDGTLLPMPIISGDDTNDKGIGIPPDEFKEWLKTGQETLLSELDMWPNLQGIGVNIPKDDSDYGEASGPNKEDLQRRGWSSLPTRNDMKIGTLLPGERGSSSTGGLKGMKPSDVERYLNENGITGPAADKIWKKYKGLQGGIDLPLAHNYRQGPTDGKLYNLLMIRANELRNQGRNQEAIDLMKIATPLYRLEQV